MIEQVYQFSTEDNKTIEKVLFDENINYIHMVFEKGDGLPVHDSNATLYMTILRGILTIGLNDQEPNTYAAGTLLKIPNATKMNVKNQGNTTLELIVVKAPVPEQ